MSPLSWFLVGFVTALAFLRWVVPNPQAIKFVAAKNIPRELLVVSAILFGAFVAMTQYTLWRVAYWPAVLETLSRLAWWVWVLLAVAVVLGAIGLVGRRLRKEAPPQPTPS